MGVTMNRLTWLGDMVDTKSAILLLLLIITITPAEGATPNPQIERVVIIDVDALRTDTLYDSNGNYNSNVVNNVDMPYTKSILDNGIRFTDATTVYPSVTLTSQATIFTGNYPQNHSISGNKWFDKNNLELRHYSSDVWWNLFSWDPLEGQANLDLNDNVKTIYEVVDYWSDPGLFDHNNEVIFNHYWRGGGETKIVRPGIDEWENMHFNTYWDVDEEAIDHAIEILNEVVDSPDKILTIYFAGFDGFSHWQGPTNNYSGGLNSQEYYFKNYIEPQIKRLIEGDWPYIWPNKGLKDSLDKTLIVLVADHGQTNTEADLTHQINSSDIDTILQNIAIYTNEYTEENDLDIAVADVVVAHNAGITHLYVQNDLGTYNDRITAGATVRGTWDFEPNWSDVKQIA
jgi:predicted AlkP superfamily pyrophosphatase or phosphodiesterase